MEISFCDRCDASIPRVDLERGRAHTREGVLLCARCLRRARQGRTLLLLVLPLSLLAASALGAVVAVYSLLPRIERLETDRNHLTTRVEKQARDAPGEAVLDEIRGLATIDAEQSEAIGAIRATVVATSADLAAVADAVRELSDHVVQVAAEIRALKDHLRERTPEAVAPPGENGGVDLSLWLPRVTDPDPGVRLSALLALDESRDARVATAAIDAMADADSLVRAEAARMAGDRKDEAAVPGLIDLLSDRNVRVRAVAEKALMTIAGQDFGYDPTDSEESREAAIERFRAWSQSR